MEEDASFRRSNSRSSHPSPHSPPSGPRGRRAERQIFVPRCLRSPPGDLELPASSLASSFSSGRGLDATEAGVRHVEEPLDFLEAAARSKAAKRSMQGDRLRCGPRDRTMHADCVEEEEASRRQQWEVELSRRLQGRANVAPAQTPFIRLEQAQRLYHLFASDRPQKSRAEDAGGGDGGVETREGLAESEEEESEEEESEDRESDTSSSSLSLSTQGDEERAAEAVRRIQQGERNGEEKKKRKNARRETKERRQPPCPRGKRGGASPSQEEQGERRTVERGQRARRSARDALSAESRDELFFAQDPVREAVTRILAHAGTVGARASLNKLWQGHHQQGIKQLQVLLREQEGNVKREEDRRMGLLSSLAAAPHHTREGLLAAAERAVEEARRVQVELETELLQAVDDATAVYRHLREAVEAAVSGDRAKRPLRLGDAAPGRDKDQAGDSEEREEREEEEGRANEAREERGKREETKEAGTRGGWNANEGRKGVEKEGDEEERKGDAERQRRKCRQHLLALLCSILGDLQRYREQLDPPVVGSFCAASQGGFLGAVAPAEFPLFSLSRSDFRGGEAAPLASVYRQLAGSCLSPSLRAAFLCYVEGVHLFPHDGLVFNQLATLCCKLQHHAQRRSAATPGADAGCPRRTRFAGGADDLDDSCAVTMQALAAVYWCLRGQLCAFPLRSTDSLTLLLQRLSAQDDSRVQQLCSGSAGGAAPSEVSVHPSEVSVHAGVWAAKAQVREHRKAALALTRNPLAVFVSLYFRLLHRLQSRIDLSQFHVHASECLSALRHLQGVWTPHAPQHEAFWLLVVLTPLLMALGSAGGCLCMQAQVAAALAEKRDAALSRRIAERGSRRDKEASAGRGDAATAEQREDANASATVRMYAAVPTSLRRVAGLERAVEKLLKVRERRANSGQRQEAERGKQAEADSQRAGNSEDREEGERQKEEGERQKEEGGGKKQGSEGEEEASEGAEEDEAAATLRLSVQLCCDIATSLTRQAISLIRRVKAKKRDNPSQAPESCQPAMVSPVLSTAQGRTSGGRGDAGAEARAMPSTESAFASSSHSLDTQDADPSTQLSTLLAPICTCILFLRSHPRLFFSDAFASVTSLRQQVATAAVLLFPPILDEAKATQRETSILGLLRHQLPEDFLLFGLVDQPLCFPPESPYASSSSASSSPSSSSASLAASASPQECGGDKEPGPEDERSEEPKADGKREERHLCREDDEGSGEEVVLLDKPILLIPSGAQRGEPRNLASSAPSSSASSSSSSWSAVFERSETTASVETAGEVEGETAGGTHESLLAAASRRKPLFPSPSVSCTVETADVSAFFQIRCARLWTLCVDTPEFQNLYQYAHQVSLQHRDKLFLLHLEKTRERQRRQRLLERVDGREAEEQADEGGEDQPPGAEEEASGDDSGDRGGLAAEKASDERSAPGRITTADLLAQVNRSRILRTSRVVSVQQIEDRDREGAAVAAPLLQGEEGRRRQEDEVEKRREGEEPQSEKDVSCDFSPGDWVEAFANAPQEEPFLPHFLAGRQNRRRRLTKAKKTDLSEPSDEEGASLAAAPSPHASPQSPGVSAASPGVSAASPFSAPSPPAFARHLVDQELQRQAEEAAVESGLLSPPAGGVVSGSTCGESPSASSRPAKGMLLLTALPPGARGSAKREGLACRVKGEGAARLEETRRGDTAGRARPVEGRAGGRCRLPLPPGDSEEDWPLFTRDTEEEPEKATEREGERGEESERMTVVASPPNTSGDSRPEGGSGGGSGDMKPLTFARKREKEKEADKDRGVCPAFLAASPTEGRGKLIVIDGSNVAMRHGGGRTAGLTKAFSTKGIEQAVKHYTARGYTVRVFLPDYVLNYASVGEAKRMQKMTFPLKAQLATRIPDSLEALRDLMRAGLVVNTPSQDYDDSYAIMYAMKHGGCIVTNDLYRDFITKSENPHSIRRWMRLHLISFVFIEDEFIPNPDFRWPTFSPQVPETS
ncbi:putative ribonuclease ZC3H12D [Toxoplasma gondii ARI]|uniref:Putative ribonuclease ZC3H12D n=1 Tax=Toxoplasma gondii ARI TaxID=1074872 RepID=A0A139Y3C4_TOXGO|nr:putative ribonuclease ZC3H12D [Toxoplasma gondii ARI]